jgi:hypothetical protein
VILELINEVLNDYSDYCHSKLIEEFKCYDSSKYDSIYWYQRYKHRIIDAKKWELIEALDLLIPSKYQSAYELIKQDILSGESLKKYQSRKLKTLDYDDDMLSHWGIQHLHLGLEVQSDGYIERTDDLLFVFFKESKAYIVGIYNHTSWCDMDIIESIHKNWPSELAVYKSNSTAPALTQEQYKTLRSKNACCNIVVSDGTEYMPPGGGVTANGAPMTGTFNSQKIINMFNVYFETIKENIELILDSDPEQRRSETITVGMRICHESKGFIYKIKETGFEFNLQS